jgi:hypothetical protein
MNILIDFHHSSLWYSLKLLLEDRLGHKIFRPVGLEWQEKGYWNYTSNNDKYVAQQFLVGFSHELVIGQKHDDYIEIEELFHGYTQKGLTFDQFLKMDIDIVIPTVKNHEELFAKLIADHKPNAKLIRQEGNNDFTINEICKNVMSSVPPNGIKIPEGTNIVYYHQEFDTNLFNNYSTISDYNRISNFMNCLPEWESINDWNKIKELLPNYDFKMHGIGGEDGNIDRIEHLAYAIKKSSFVFQLKQGENGGGHITHNAMACGKPLICKRSYLKYLFDSGVLEHMVTCIDLEQSDDWKRDIEICSEPSKYNQMSEELYLRWKELVNFDIDEVLVRQFLDRLI